MTKLDVAHVVLLVGTMALFVVTQRWDLFLTYIGCGVFWALAWARFS